MNPAKKNIVLLTDCIADLQGGAEKQIYELARGLDKSAYEVHVASLDCTGQAPREIIESTGSRLHIFRVVRIYGLSGIIQGLRFYKFLKGNRIDVIVTYHFSSDMWGTFWGHLAGVKMIFSNRRDMGFWRNGLHIAAYKLMNHWVNKVVVVSASIRDMVIQEEGFAAERIEIIYNGVELPEKPKESPQESRVKFGLKENDTVIMHVANLKPVKGHKYLLEAFAGIIAQHPHSKLVLIGRDELNGQLQRRAQELNISDKVLFLGKRDDAQSLLAMADICVLPSLSEGMSNAILEYMAAQKPVVVTRVGGNPELVVDGHNGFLVDKENSQQLKNTLLALIDDRQKRLEMGRAGYQMAQKEFSMRAMLSKYGYLFSGIKVLHLISSGGLFGAERVVLNLAAKSDGVVSFVGALNNRHNSHLEIIDEAKGMGLHTVVFDSRGQFDLACVSAVKKFIIDQKIDIVHTHNYKSDIIGFLATRFTTVQWMATNHLWHGTDPKMRFYEHIDAFVLKFARKVIGVSAAIKEDMVRRQLKEDHLGVIDNGICIEKFEGNAQAAELRSSWGIAHKDCAVLIAGRLAVEKGHEIFLNAAAEVVKSVPDVKFVIVGDGPLRDKLEQQTVDLGLSSHVIFTGIRKDMPAVYSACNIMVNASYAEGLPMTILEAMSSRLAIIATDVGAVGEVIKAEENGILLKPGDAHQLALAVIRLARDPQERQRMAGKAYEDVCARFSDLSMARKYKQVYREVLFQ